MVVVFFIFVSREISASDYKRLVRGGGADWVSTQDAPHEIAEIISRTSPKEAKSVRENRFDLQSWHSCRAAAGSATPHLRSKPPCRSSALSKRAVGGFACWISICRPAIFAIISTSSHDFASRRSSKTPTGLDAQLFDLFVSRHAASGVDVLATPRNRRASIELNMPALDALFRFISEQYDLVFVNVPLAWFDWTDQILAVCDLAIVTGLNNIPGLRQIAETLQAVKNAERVPPQIVVALNRCESGLVGGIARRGHVSRALGNQTVVYVREDTAAANHSLNTGVPISITSRSSKITRDIRALASLVSGLSPGHAQVTGASNRYIEPLAAQPI